MTGALDGAEMGIFMNVVLANLIVCLAGFVQASVGIGFAMIAVPLLVLVDIAYAPGPSLFVMLFLSTAMVLVAWRDIDTNGLTMLLPGLLAGTIASTFLFELLTPTFFGLFLGSVVLAILVLGQLGYTPRRSPLEYGAGGVLAGLMGTLLGIHGPPMVVLYQNASPAQARATIALVFVIGSCLSLASLHRADLFGAVELRAGLFLLPGLGMGFAIAQKLHNLVSPQFARIAMLSIAALSSAILIGKAFF